MIRITRLSDYGIVLLSHLAVQPTRLYTAPDLASEARLPAPMVSKILKKLARSGLLASHRGAHGGYNLARPAADITVAEIITALEGRIAVTECIEDACGNQAFCPVESNWQRINRAIQDALTGITLAEMSRPASLQLVSLGGRH